MHLMLGTPGRKFLCKTVLLFWCGDYPGQGKISGFSHAANGRFPCHWCKVGNKFYLRGHGEFPTHRCGLKADNPLRRRTDLHPPGETAPPATHGPWPLREHEACSTLGREQQEYTGAAKDRPPHEGVHHAHIVHIIAYTCTLCTQDVRL